MIGYSLQLFAHGLSQGVTKAAPWLANHLWQTTAFVGLAALLTLALRGNQARARHGIWVAASLKFLVPLALVATLGSHFAKAHPAQAAQPAVYGVVEDFSEPVIFQHVGQAEAHVSEARHGAPGFVAAYVPIFGAAVWVAGFVTILVTFAIRWRGVAISLRGARRLAEGREVEALGRLQAAANLRRRIPLLLSQTQMEPGVFGIFRPVLAWPSGLSARLDEAQLEAVLAHEVAHVRRRDNLTAALHTLVQAAFWFHPLVWWIGARMVAERERACDEAVLELCARPEAYAESILKVCEFCVESPLACVSGITGADLKQRVVDIMTARVARRLTIAKKLLIVAAGLCTVAVPVLLAQAKATQRMLAMIAAAPAPVRTIANAMIAKEEMPPTEEIGQAKPDGVSQPMPEAELDNKAVPFHFDAVSIHPSDPSAGQPRLIGFQFTEDGILATNIPLEMMLMFQYQRELQLDSSRIVGGPDWVRTQRWNLRAKVADADQAEWSALAKDPSPAATARRKATALALLAERFSLKIHSEMKEGTVYALVIAEGGLKIKPSTQTPGHQTIRSHRPGNVEGTIEIPALAPVFAQELGHPVIDKTGTSGLYDFALDWQPMRAPAQSAAGAAGESAPPSLFTAVQEQLGLKLVAEKGPIEHLVIDHAEKPSVDGAEVGDPSPKLIPADMAGPFRTYVPQAQAAYDPTMVFDVASVRQSKVNIDQGVTVTGHFIPANSCHVRFQNFDLMNLIVSAYTVESYQISGLEKLPEDMRRAFFNLEAKCDPASEQRIEKLGKKERGLEQEHMMAVLLAERFKLKTHWETREGSTYDLVVSKPGRLHAGGPPPTAEQIAAWGDRGIPALYQHGDSRTGFEYTAHGATAADIADMLAGQFGHPVNDKTGLTGKYDFNLQTYGVRARQRRDDDPNPWPPLDNAIEEQLGLKLVPSHGPIQTLVIDHMEMPSEN